MPAGITSCKALQVGRQAREPAVLRERNAMRSSRHGLLIGACIIVMGGGAGAVSAQTAAASPRDCHRIVISAERLACYDVVSGRVADAPKGVEPAARPAEVARGADGTLQAGSSTLSMIDES